jgi:16S rRNA (guanine(966)-N(2))-methyltransferase RsmD
MRIIGGQHKGRPIPADARLHLRPTTDFAKEGLFNMLASRVDWEGLHALDLFSGTGSIAYEMASRGAESVHAVEMNPQHANFIRKTAATLNLRNLKVVRDEAFHFLSICKVTYGLIFADPPYDMDISALPDAVLSRNLLEPDGVFVIEHSKNTDFSAHERLLQHRHYGNVHFSFFR